MLPLPSILLSSLSSSTSIAAGTDSSTWIKTKLCLTLRVHHLPKLASALTFFVALFDDPSLFEDVDEVLELDVGEVVTDDNGSLESLQDEGMEASGKR